MAEALQETFLYEFKLDANVWRFTSNAVDVVDTLGNLWVACAISDNGVKQTGEAITDELQVTTPQRIAPVQLFKFATPSRDVALNKFRASIVPLIEDQLVSNPTRQVTNVRATYAGEIEQCSFPMPGTAVFAVTTLSATMKRQGLRLGWQRQCPYCVYDLSCTVPKPAHARTVTITSIVGFTVTVSGTLEVTAQPNIYDGGIIEFQHPVKGIESLTIEAQTGALQFLMFGSVEGLYVGMPITAYRGCRNDPTSCRDIGNYLQYGGHEHLPGQSPFDGVNSPIF